MIDLLTEITESFRIAALVIRAHKMRSALTALGVIIGIIAVTLMGSAIGGIETGFERSLAVIGDDILYVEKWPWSTRRRLVELPQPPDDAVAVRAGPAADHRRDAELRADDRRADDQHHAQREVRGQRSARRVHAGDDRRVSGHVDVVVPRGAFLQRARSALRPQRSDPRIRRRRSTLPERAPPRQDGDDQRHAVQGHRRLREAGDVSRAVQLRHVCRRAVAGISESIQLATRYVDPREGSRQEPDGSGDGRVDRGDAPRARSSPGAEERLLHQRAAGAAQHDRSDQERHRRGRPFRDRPGACSSARSGS